MEAIIKSIKLKKFLNRHYFCLEIQDINGIVYFVDKPLLSDPVSFRKQVFGIMTVCNQFDLLRLGTDNPDYKYVIGYYSNGLQILESEGNMWFAYNKDTGSYFFKNADQKLKSLFNFAIDKKISDVFVEKGRIESIISGSGVFQILFNAEGVCTFMNTGQVYYGFGEPINIGDKENKEGIRSATLAFQSFVLSIMDFYGVNDLLQLGGNVDKYPIVDIIVDKNKIISIMSVETGLGFSLDNNFAVLHTFGEDDKKTLY